MTMSSRPHRTTPANVYARFTEVTAALAGRAPEEDLATFGELLLLRDDLFEQLALPATSHNSLRLYDHAAAGLPLEAFLRDTDQPLPAAVLDDEGLLLSTLAAYFDRRGVGDREGRVYDALALLGAPYHPHNVATVAAWLDDALPYPTARALLLTDDEALDAAIC